MSTTILWKCEACNILYNIIKLTCELQTVLLISIFMQYRSYHLLIIVITNNDRYRKQSSGSLHITFLTYYNDNIVAMIDTNYMITLHDIKYPCFKVKYNITDGILKFKLYFSNTITCHTKSRYYDYLVI